MSAVYYQTDKSFRSKAVASDSGNNESFREIAERISGSSDPVGGSEESKEFEVFAFNHYVTRKESCLQIIIYS